MSKVIGDIEDGNGGKTVEFIIQSVIGNNFGGICKMFAFSAASSQMYSLNKTS